MGGHATKAGLPFSLLRGCPIFSLYYSVSDDCFRWLKSPKSP